MNDTALWLTWLIFLATYAGLAVGKVPSLRIDRAGIAFVGAALVLITRVLSFDEAVSAKSIDYSTLALLFGMMVLLAYLRLSGFFLRLANWTIGRITSPRGLLAVTIALSGILSAFLINDIVCLTLTPLVLNLARRLEYDPVPHLIGVATAANIGSAGTITGNPQNIYIGSHSGIPYGRFALHLLPVAAIGLLLCFAIVALVYRRQLRTSAASNSPLSPRGRGAGGEGANPPNGSRPENDTPKSKTAATAASRRRPHAWLQKKSIVVTLVTVVLFFLGFPLELVALGAAALMLLGRVNPDKVYREVDWGLLVMFTGLFIVVYAFQVHVVSRWGIDRWHWLLDRPVDLLSLVSAALSNVVSNVPAVLLLEPLVKAMPAASRQTAWLSLAMSSTLAGNLTILGSVANLIVVEKAKREGVIIGFWEYCKVGLPLTIATLIVGVLWLEWIE